MRHETDANRAQATSRRRSAEGFGTPFRIRATKKREPILPVVDNRAELANLPCPWLHVAAAKLHSEVRAVRRGAEDLRRFTCMLRFSGWGSGEVHNPFVEHEPAVELEVPRTLIQHETFGVSEPEFVNADETAVTFNL